MALSLRRVLPFAVLAVICAAGCSKQTAVSSRLLSAEAARIGNLERIPLAEQLVAHDIIAGELQSMQIALCTNHAPQDNTIGDHTLEPLRDRCAYPRPSIDNADLRID